MSGSGNTLRSFQLTMHRLQEETAKVEEHLLDGSFSAAIVRCFAHAEKDAFENLLEPLQKLLRLSPPVAAQLSHPQLFSRAAIKLNNKKPHVRLNLLRIIRNVCDSSEDQGSLIKRYGLFDAIERLAEHDPAILVRNMASDLVHLSELSERRSVDASRYPGARRTSSSIMTPPPLYNSSSLPPTPQRSSGQSSSSYFDLGVDSYHPPPRSRISNIGGSTPYRPVSREGPGSGLTPGFSNLKIVNEHTSLQNVHSPQAQHRPPSRTTGNILSPSNLSTTSSAASKSRLPHRPSTTAAAAPTSTRMGRSSTASSNASRQENMPPPPTPTPQHGPQAAPARNHMLVNPRRRRQTSNGGGT